MSLSGLDRVACAYASLVKGPLAVPAFRWLFAGQVVSGIGDAAFPVAVAALVVGRGGSASDLGLVLAARFAALVLFALLGGVWADRLPRVRMMRVADALRLVAVLGLAVGAQVGDPSVLLLAALVFAVGAGEAFFRPAYGALLPSVLDPEDLAPGNALSGASRFLAQVVGPGLAGLLLLALDPAALFALDAATFGVSLATLVRVAEPAFQAAPRRRLHSEVAEGFSAVRARPWLAAVLAMSSVQLLLASAPVTVLTPLVLRDLGEPGSTYGLVLSVGAVGGLLGALVAARWRPSRPGVAGLAALSAYAVTPLALALCGPVWTIAAATFVGLLGLGPFNIWWETALQRAVPRELLARVISLDWLCSLALLPLGLALVGPAVGLLGRGPVLGTAVVVMLVTSALPLLVPGVARLADPGLSEVGGRVSAPTLEAPCAGPVTTPTRPASSGSTTSGA